MDSFPSFHPKINKNVPSKDKKIKNSSKLFRSSLDISGINDNQSELFVSRNQSKITMKIITPLLDTKFN